jgi:nucleoside-diphosphate-sugar epimerase
MSLKNQTILITGTDEFIGWRAAELALSQGMQVRGLQSSPTQDKKSENPGMEIFIGKITDPIIAQTACQGVDCVLHTTQFAEESGEIKHFREINVDGTVNIATAAKQAHVKTFIHLSSVLVYGFNYRDNVTESEQISGENNPYCQSKLEAETELIKLSSTDFGSDFGIVIIRAGDVYGPGSIPWIARPVHMMRQNLFAYANNGQGVMNHVYVDNLIDAVFLAIEKKPYGEVFNVTDGQETSWKDYFTQLAAIAGLPTPRSMPKEEMKLFLRMRLQGQKLFRKKADILPESVDFMSRPYAYSIASAVNKLNYQPKIGLEQGMQLTNDWLQKTDIQKLLK